MDIIKQPSPNSRIHFFRNTEQPDWFFVTNSKDKWVAEFYLKSHHLPPHENSGYEDLPIEWAFALEVGDTRIEDFLDFIRYQKGIKHGNPEDSQVSWIGANGWYEFPDINNIDNWLNDFYDFQKKKYEDSRKANKNGMQTSLF